MARAE
jgi:chaperonin cofactor prefoldin